MLNLALVALLSGSLFAAPDGDCKKKRTCERDQAPIAVEATNDTRSIIGDTYAFGRAADSAPIKLWVEFGRGTTEEIYLPDGTELDTGTNVTGLRGALGVQFNVVNTSSFKFGVGGQLNIASDEFRVGGATIAESGFGLQGAKIYGMLRGRVVGVHGGYFLDLASDPDASNTITASDQLDVIFFGADFDYPSEPFRLFGVLDYYMPQEGDVVFFQGADAGGGEGTVTVTQAASDNILMFTMGAGFRFSVFELGAALLFRAQEDSGIFNASGSSAATIAPYLRISPPSLPVSIYFQGAVAREYADYGYNLSGGNDVVSGFGATVGLTIGFE
ncbi:MAG: hypothetical protein IIC18_09570 [Bacteroidetes bacterium]|nr:hypothetical protein [Bacteroidota bacterium]